MVVLGAGPIYLGDQLIAGGPIPTFADYISAAQSLTPWALYPLQEVSGSTVADVSGNARTGTLSGSIQLGMAGPLGANAAGWISGTPGITLGAAIDLTASWSIVAWLYQLSAADQSYILGSENAISLGNIYWCVNNRDANALCVQSRTGEVTTFAPSSGPKAPTNGTWNLVGITRSGSSLSFYINGQLSHTGTNPTVPAGVTDLAIGRLRTSTLNSFSGRMAGVGIYQSALTAQNHEDLYEAAFPA